MVIPIGVDSFRITVEVTEDATMGMVNNHAYLDGIFFSSKTITERIRSDDPETAIPDDPTTFEVDKLSIDFENQRNVICAGDTLLLNPNIENALAYAWNTGASTPSIRTYQAGIYTVTVTTSCETASGSIEVIADFIQVDLGEDMEIEQGEEVQLAANVRSDSEITLYFWQGVALSCNTCPETIAQPMESGFYSVEVENSNACKASGNVFIGITDFQLFQPNIFLPQ
ncbi:MAG: hypothetical protein HC912_04435 [Saprospiraceae bacterium]|nr:hypothetical protein [Saprospiraceae bacterium]